jgi:hypothetical protein
MQNVRSETWSGLEVGPKLKSDCRTKAVLKKIDVHPSSGVGVDIEM